MVNENKLKLSKRYKIEITYSTSNLFFYSFILHYFDSRIIYI